MPSASAEVPAQRPTAIVVLDFDGTVCLGDDPVRFYAQEVAARVPAARRGALLDGLERFLAGELELEGCEDGYHAVVALAGQGPDPVALSDAYRVSRARLDAGEGDTSPPEGLAVFLDELRSLGAAVVLVTNAPLLGVGSWLARYDLAERLDAIVPDAGKPGRMAAILTGILAEYGVGAQRLASVGDVWRNDIEPALALGAAGMYIDRFGSGRTPSSATAATFEDLYPVILRWVGRAAAEAETESSPN